MDRVWFRIVDMVELAAAGLDQLYAPLEALGPAAVITAVAFSAVVVSKLLDRFIPETRRQIELQGEFDRLYQLRREALGCGDPEKGKQLALNIDQAELNGVYYNLFFEKFMRNLITTYLPIFSFMAYVNEAYSPAALAERFSQPGVVALPTLSGGWVPAGGVLWYLVSVVGIYLLWFVVRQVIARYRTRNGGQEPPAFGAMRQSGASGSTG